ncbi:MAG: ABC transporter substrate-binding protein [Rhodobacteraceae bacterium]|nr:ABC transporter substrate-binding protein [Paracoccaceae bacterium]
MANSFKNKLLATTTAMIMTSGAAYAEETIKVGILMPISGGGASYGVPAVDGVKMAVDEINNAGGVDGMKIEYFVRDSQLKPDVAVAAARELITKEGVDVLVGAVSSGATLAISELAKQEQIPLLAPVAKAAALTSTKLHPYIFQLAATTDSEGRQMADVLKTIGAEKVCVSGFDYAYSHDLFESLDKNLPDGIEIVDTFHVKLGTTDYSAVISQLMGSDCDTVAGAVWGGGFIAYMKQAGPFGVFDTKKLVWGAEVGSSEMAGALKGDYPEGMYAAAYDLWYVEGSEAHKEFLANLAVIEGTNETKMYPVTTYIAIQFIAEAVRKAGSSDPKEIAKALVGLSIDTPLGKRTIDPDNHRTNTGEFWGPMVTVSGTEAKQMSPAEYLE